MNTKVEMATIVAELSELDPSIGAEVVRAVLVVFRKHGGTREKWMEVHARMWDSTDEFFVTERQ